METHFEMVGASDKETPSIEMQPAVKVEEQVTVTADKQSDVTEKMIDKAAVNYRFTKRSALGMFLVACAAFFGR